MRPRPRAGAATQADLEGLACAVWQRPYNGNGAGHSVLAAVPTTTTTSPSLSCLPWPLWGARRCCAALQRHDLQAMHQRLFPKP